MKLYSAVFGLRISKIRYKIYTGVNYKGYVCKRKEQIEMCSIDWQDFLTVIVIPASASFIALVEYKRTVQHAVLEFLSQGNTEEEKKRRKELYQKCEEKKYALTLDDLKRMDDASGDIAKIISFYDAWAIMVKKRYLPIKYFKGINGVTAVRLFYILEPYIEYRQNKDTEIVNQVVISNKSYAENFKWLVATLCIKDYVQVEDKNKERFSDFLKDIRFKKIKSFFEVLKRIKAYLKGVHK